MDFLKGWKTKIAAAITLAVAVNSVVHVVPQAVEQPLLALAASLGLYGLRAAIQRGTGA